MVIKFQKILKTFKKFRHNDLLHSIIECLCQQKWNHFAAETTFSKQPHPCRPDCRTMREPLPVHGIQAFHYISYLPFCFPSSFCLLFVKLPNFPFPSIVTEHIQNTHKTTFKNQTEFLTPLSVVSVFLVLLHFLSHKTKWLWTRT